MSKEEFSKLRRQAEAQLAGRERQIESLGREELARIAHELAVHQVELEIQNEELLRARMAVEEARDRYLDLYDFAPVGYVTLDEHNRVEEANLTASGLFGLEARNKLLKTRFTKYVDSEESNRFYLYARKTLGSEDRQTLELKMQKGDGTPFYAQLVGIKAGVGRLRIAVVDITKLKKMEKALVKAKAQLETEVSDRTSDLLKSEEDYRRIVETANEGVWITDTEGKIVFVNKKITELTGYSRRELIGHEGLDFLVRGQSELVFSMRKNLHKGARTANELQVRRKDGSRLWFLANAAPLYEQRKHTRNLYMMTDITEWKRTEAELHDIPRRILHAQEAERQAIGRELHDEAGQSLTYITLLLDRFTRVPPEEGKDIIREAGETTRKVLGQIRNLSLNLQPGNLEHLGLTETLALHFGDFTSKTGIEVHFDFSGDCDKVPYELALTLYRICQEALTNVARHAGVREASVYLRADADMIRLVVKDAGTGFNPRTYRRDSSGIVGMKERAKILGGSLEIVSAPGRGTWVTAELPLKNTKHQGQKGEPRE